MDRTLTHNFLKHYYAGNYYTTCGLHINFTVPEEVATDWKYVKCVECLRARQEN